MKSWRLRYFDNPAALWVYRKTSTRGVYRVRSMADWLRMRGR
jgi:hypothetical protein